MTPEEIDKILMERRKQWKPKELDGEDAFKLYDTYGFPLDLTKEILEEKGYTVNEEAFQTCMNEQKEKARNARKTTNYMGADVTVYESIDPSVTSTFVGYDTQECDSKITVMTTDTEKFIALIDKYENFDTLTNTMLNEFVEKILVHERSTVLSKQ